MTGQTYELSENHWRIPDDQGVHNGPSKREVEAVRRWKIATTFVFLIALVAFGVAVVALAELKNRTPQKPKDEPKTSAQIMSVNETLLVQENELKKVENSINQLKQALASQSSGSKSDTNKVNLTLTNVRIHVFELAKSFTGAQKEIRTIETSVNSVIKNIKRVSDGLKQSNANAGNRTKAVDASLSTQSAALQKLQDSLNDTSQKLDDANKQVSFLISHTSSLATNSSKLQDQINSLFDKQSDDVTSLKQNFKTFNKTLDGAVDTIQAQYNALNNSVFNETDDLRQDASALDARVSKNEDDIVSVKSDIGWIPIFNGYEYLVKRSGNNFTDSRAFCQKKGGDLAHVGLRTNETRRYITENFFPEKTRYSIWIGLSDRQVEGEWTWIDGVKATDTNTDFVPGEPNNYRGRQDCSYMHKFANGYQMADYYCSRLFSALCERRIGY